VPVDLVKEGENKYSVSVKPLSGNQKAQVWSFTDILPKALVISDTAAYYFSNESAITVKGRVNMNLVKGDGTALAVKVTNGQGKCLYESKTPVTGNDLLFTLPLAALTAEENYTIEFTLLIKGKKAGSAKRSFYVMKSI
jgi:hypothetical protein